MTRRLRPIAIALCAAAMLTAQERPHSSPEPGHAQAAGTPHEGGDHADTTTNWKWANFVILAVAIGYMAAKHGGPFFRQRTDEIRKGIGDAAAEKQAAELRFSEIERRLGNLDAEVAAIRSRALEEMNAESARIRQVTAQQLAKVHTVAEQEIASVTKAARQELKNYSAALALDLAERRVRDRMTPQVQNGLVADFAESLSNGGRR